MRYRDYKLFRSGCYYHVYNRGNNKQRIFLTDKDHLNFLKRIKFILGMLPVTRYETRIRPLPVGAFSIVAYCLMPNHFHFLIRQNTETGVDAFIKKLCTSYVGYFNRQYQHVGGLFQDQFKAKLVENDSYAKYLSAYIHSNPANLEYPYSSYLDIIGSRQGKIVDRSVILSWFENKPEMYQQFVEDFGKKEEQQIQDLLFDED